MPDRTGHLQPWKDKQPISSERLNHWQDQTITNITVQQNTPLTMLRNGNSVVIGWRGQASGGARPDQNIGTEVGQVPQMVSNNAKAWQQFEGTP